LIIIIIIIIILSGVEFQEGWARSAYFGVSASTGALTDFHDIISIKAYNV
jgi:hypothetical protein